MNTSRLLAPSSKTTGSFFLGGVAMGVALTGVEA
jgi:hypothetical protein